MTILRRFFRAYSVVSQLFDSDWDFVPARGTRLGLNRTKSIVVGHYLETNGPFRDSTESHFRFLFQVENQIVLGHFSNIRVNLPTSFCRAVPNLKSAIELLRKNCLRPPQARQTTIVHLDSHSRGDFACSRK